jgi:hypothetical protein
MENPKHPCTTTDADAILTPASLYDQARALVTLRNGVDDGPPGRFKIICFDFDRTLATIHLTEALVHSHGCKAPAEYMRAFADTFGSRPADVFGGEERVRMLEAALSRLTGAGARLFVITMGECAVVQEALRAIGLLQYFEGITEDNPKPSAVQALMNTRFERRLRGDQALLLDDTVSNFRNASDPDEMRKLGLPNDFVQLFYEPSKRFPKEEWGKTFEIGVLTPGTQGFCYCMLVDKATGVTRDLLEQVVTRTECHDDRSL